MPTYRLTPIDPANGVWESSGFVEPVWTNAVDEACARGRVSLLAHAIKQDPWSRRPKRHFLWLFSATCAVDADHPGIAPGKVVAADGRVIGH
jgi:hypothetical protein